MENKFREDINYYKILQVDPGANPLVIKSSYYTILNQLKCHPDKGGDEENAKLINEAYRILSSERLREEYDQFLSTATGKSHHAGTDEIGIIRVNEQSRRRQRKKSSAFDDFFSIDRDLDHLGHFFDSFFTNTAHTEESGGQEPFPRVNIRRLGDDFTITVQVPGIPWEDLRIEVENAILTIRGVRRKEPGEWLHVEFQYGEFSRSFQLPRQSDQGKIKAALKDGILEIIIPAHESKKKRKISIRDG